MSSNKEPFALSQIREATQALLAAGKTEEAFEYFMAALAAVVRKNSDLELQLMKLRRERLGMKSERMSAEQLMLMMDGVVPVEEEEAPRPDTSEQSRQDAVVEQEIETERQVARAGQQSAGSRKRNWRARNVKRQVHHVAVAPEERTCPECGQQRRRMGEDITRTLEYVPAHFVEHEYHLEKYACGTCKVGVSTAAAPAKVIERSEADASVLAHVVVSKYADHTPLHRLQRSYKRSGVEIPVSTLADWVAGVAERVEPVVELLIKRVLRAYLVRTDATGLKVLDPSSPENIERGTMWCYVGDDRDVVFRYTPTGEGESGPWEFLAGRHGYIQADAATVFDRLFNGGAASAIEVGCWAHARRKFVALADTDMRVAYPLLLIRRLYRLEVLADLKKLTGEQRAVFRAERMTETLQNLKEWLTLTLQNEPPGSELAKAAGYGLRQWIALTQFLQDGALGLDNNLCEQQLRDVALGRKNYLFAGSHAAAKRTAALYTLMRTSAQHRVPPLPYLTDVLRKLASGWPKDRLEELLPDRWQLLHNRASPASV
ncbi:MAG: IS66 family transposase [Gemmatimonadota bacterium]